MAFTIAAPNTSGWQQLKDDYQVFVGIGAIFQQAQRKVASEVGLLYFLIIQKR